MELSSTITNKWKVGTVWSISGCLILLLILNHKTQQMPTLLVAPLDEINLSTTSIDIQRPPEPELGSKKPEPEPEPEPSYDITVNDNTNTTGANHVTNTYIKKLASETSTTKKKCNIFEGKWVFNPEQVPSYDSTRCPFIEEKFSCQKNGRPDSNYEKWRWEANDCDIPLFDGMDMLEKLRNKRVIIVGDSLNRNQWESLACLLYSSVSPSRAEVDAQGQTYKFFKAKDYNCSVEFYWSPLLVELRKARQSNRRVLVLDKMPDTSKQWRGADIMVFNSWLWWIHPNNTKRWDVFQYKGQLIEEMPREVAFERGIRTWVRWIKTNVDQNKTKVFFVSTLPQHKGKHWCYNSTQPITDIDSYESGFPKSLIEVFERLIKVMSKLQVKYLNITKLSEYRRDAHPSIYANLHWKHETSRTYKTDCCHWCLPGLPDTWNRLLYASLFFDS